MQGSGEQRGQGPRRLGALAALLAAAACAAPQEQPVAAPAALPVSYDGRWAAQIQTVRGAGSVPAESCATDSRVTFEVRNNTFTYAQRHPNAETNDRLGGSATVTYAVTIKADGSLEGFAQDAGGTVIGRVNGSRMEGQVNGLLCYYNFTAQRV